MSFKIKLNNGEEMPAVGLGTYLGTGLDELVKQAVDIGYRLFDTAFYYQNEDQIGRGLKEKFKEGSLKRESLFVVSKLWNTHHRPEDVIPALQKSLSDLELDYVDLYLMHWPLAAKKIDNPHDIEKLTEDLVPSIEATWTAMEECVKLGYAKSLGVSNFNSQQIDRILRIATVKPVVNQVEANPYFNQKKLIAFCKARDIAIMAYSPFYAFRRYRSVDHGLNLFEEPILKELAKKYERTVTQIILRFLIQFGVIPVPKTNKVERLKENLDVFDFSLSNEDMQKVEGLNCDLRCTPYADASKFREYPFHIEY